MKLMVGDVDDQRMTLCIEQGKGRKNRCTVLSPVLLECLCFCWQALDIDVQRVREKAHLLDGIAPEAARLLKVGR